MKKIVILALALVFALSLVACGGNNDNNSTGGNNNTNPPASQGGNDTGDDKPDMSLPEIEAGSKEWPTAYLPKDLPEFNANATHIMMTVIGEPGEISISYVTKTTTAELMEYLNGLKSNGWTLKESTVEGMGDLTKGKWEITYSTGEASNQPGTFNHTLIFKYDK